MTSQRKCVPTKAPQNREKVKNVTHPGHKPWKVGRISESERAKTMTPGQA